MKCTVCGKEITGACYNPPSGATCVQCWEEKPDIEKEKELNKALTGLAVFAETYQKRRK
jgi:hypothetical protein